MNILIVTQYFYPETFRINDIAAGLVEKGHKVTVYTGLPNYPKGRFFKGYSLKGPYTGEYKGAKIIRVPLISRGKNKSIRLIANYLSFMIISTILAPFLCRGKFDKIFVYQLSPVTAALPAVILKWIKKAPIVFWATDLWPETLQATGAVNSRLMLNLWGKFVQFLYNRSNKILVTSKGFIEKINMRNVPKRKISYWPQWGEEIFANQAINNDLISQEEIPEGFKIMFAGNIGTSQSFETIVDAAEKLKNHADIKWVILGNGLMFNWVQEQIKVRGLEKNLFLLGSKPLETMPTYYSKADVLLAALNNDPLFAITVPAKIQSYLPSGKPILVSMNGEGAELIKDSKSGVSCAANNAQELADGALKLYQSSQAERDQMGENGRKYFFDNFKRDDLLIELERIFEATNQ